MLYAYGSMNFRAGYRESFQDGETRGHGGAESAVSVSGKVFLPECRSFSGHHALFRQMTEYFSWLMEKRAVVIDSEPWGNAFADFSLVGMGHPENKFNYIDIRLEKRVVLSLMIT